MMLRLSILILLCWSLTGCGTERSQSEVEAAIQESLKTRLDEFTKANQARCRKELLASATRVADSILLAEANLWTDTIDRPTLPTKPLPPEGIEVLDSSAIEPFLERDSL